MGVILASASPRRRELLALVCDDFKVVPSKCEEVLPDGTAAEDVPVVLSRQKCEDIAKDYPNDTVIGCDTVVVCGGKIFGKPKSKAHAKQMLGELSGRVHKVITGVTIFRESSFKSFGQTTSVEFYPLADSEIDEYIATGEPMDKAGAYGIQGKGSALVKGIQGDFFNVVGLPVARLKRELLLDKG